MTVTDVDVRELVGWLKTSLGNVGGLVAGFSGSYSSAVGLALLKKAYPGPVDPVFVMVKDDPWRMDMAERWLDVLRIKTGLRKVILNECVDDLEDQIQGLKTARAAFIPSIIRTGLEMTGRATRRPVVWFGDRNAAMTLGTPSSDISYICPLAHLSAKDVEVVGKVLGVQDGWLATWDGAPSGWYAGYKKKYRAFDKIVGWVWSHLDDVAKEFEGTGKTPSSDFSWMGWEPSDSFDRVVLLEVLERFLYRQQCRTIQMVKDTGTQPLDMDYEIQFQGTPPEDAIWIGSIRADADCTPHNLGLVLNGRTSQNEKVRIGIKLSEPKVDKLVEKLKSVENLLLPLRLQSEGDPDRWIVLSMSKYGVESVLEALSYLTAYMASLPKEMTA